MKNEVQSLKEFLHQRRNLFASKMSEMGRARSIEYEIKLQSNKPIRSRFYSAHKDKEGILDAKI